MPRRLVQQLRPTVPLGRVWAILSGEPFYGFDDTEWGQRRGFDQVRTFAGIDLPLNANASVEPGYLNQILSRRGEDRMNHIASPILNLRL